MSSEPFRALAGIRVLDLTRYLPGPFCSMILADFGAEVIKVESPLAPDPARFMPPYTGEVGGPFAAVNRNKRSLALDLKKPGGAALFLELTAACDVVLDGFRPGVLDRLGCGFERQRSANEKLICCALTGYGMTGPYRERAGHDINYSGYGGFLDLNGPAGGKPVVPGLPMADLTGGLYAAIGILLALQARERSGRGQIVDVSMLDAMVSLLTIHAGRYFGGDSPERGGWLLGGGMPCYRTYETADGGFFAIGALEPKFWATLCRLVGREDLVSSQFSTGEEGARVVAELEALFRTRTTGEWTDLLAAEETCASPVLSIPEVLADPQVLSRKLLRGGGPHLAPVPRLEETPGRIEGPPPALGQHTREILGRFGVSPGRTADLERAGVILSAT